MTQRADMKEQKLPSRALRPHKPYPFLPEGVPLSALKPNQRLCSAEEFEEEKEVVDKELKQYTLKNGEGCLVFGVNHHIFAVNANGTTEYNIIHSQEKKDIPKGGFGRVRKAQNFKTGQWFAFKSQEIKEAKKSPDKISIFTNELKNLKEHKLLAGYSFVMSRNGTLTSHLLMKLATGNDLAHIKLVDEQIHQIYFIKLLRMIVKLFVKVQELHASGWWHCDLKPENIMWFFKTGQLEIVDWAFSMPKTQPKLPYRYRTRIHMDPEDAKSRKRNEATEVYALGVSLARIFGLCDEKNKVINDHTDEIFQNNTIIPNPAVRRRILDFIKEMTASDQRARPVIARCLDFFQKEFAALLPFSNTNIGMIDISEIIKNKDNIARILPLLNALKFVDKVWMINTAEQDYTDEEYVEAEEILAQYDIHVGNKIFHEPGMTLAEVAQLIPTYKSREGYYRTYHLFSMHKPDAEALVHLKTANVGFIHAIEGKKDEQYRNEILEQEVLPEGLAKQLCTALLQHVLSKDVSSEDKETNARLDKRAAAIDAGIRFFAFPRTRKEALCQLDQIAEAQVPTGAFGKFFEKIYVYSDGKFAIKNLKQTLIQAEHLSPRLLP